MVPHYHSLISSLLIPKWNAASDISLSSTFFFFLCLLKQILKLCPKKKSSSTYTFCKSVGLLGMQFHLFENECKFVTVLVTCQMTPEDEIHSRFSHAVENLRMQLDLCTLEGVTLGNVTSIMWKVSLYQLGLLVCVTQCCLV